MQTEQIWQFLKQTSSSVITFIDINIQFVPTVSVEISGSDAIKLPYPKKKNKQNREEKCFLALKYVVNDIQLI
jgi:hypothetical protein